MWFNQDHVWRGAAGSKLQLARGHPARLNACWINATFCGLDALPAGFISVPQGLACDHDALQWKATRSRFDAGDCDP